MKTIVLDDDPTGTQSASDVDVLLEWDEDLLTATLERADSVYVQTNSRSLEEEAAASLVARVRREGTAAAARLGVPVRFVLRGDSTLRGHVFAESEVFLEDDALLLFVPAFPAGGRRTRDGVHYVSIGGEEVPAAETEYADDPVFPFHHSRLADYVQDKSGRAAVEVTLDNLRQGALGHALLTAPAGSVVVPDAVDQTDIEVIAAAVLLAESRGRRVVVRSAAPLAAELAGVSSHGLMKTPLVEDALPTLLVCGSHTAGATAQLRGVAQKWGDAIVIPTSSALTGPESAGDRAARSAEDAVRRARLAVVTSERTRCTDHNTLGHGELVMRALVRTVQVVLPHVQVVIAKGGITSADVARHGIGAQTARVLGQVLPGVSVWRVFDRQQRPVLYVVVPGNIGGPDTLTLVLGALRLNDAMAAASR